MCFTFFSGMDEVGIYRLSGATSEVRRLKDAFDNSKYIMEVNVPVPVLLVPLAHRAFIDCLRFSRPAAATRTSFHELQSPSFRSFSIVLRHVVIEVNTDVKHLMFTL